MVSLALLPRVALAQPALAQGDALGAGYLAPPECPPRAAWFSALRARLPPLLRTQPLLGTLSVQISGGPRQGYAGELESPLGSSPRSVRGATCEDVADALSFIAALELERIAASAAAGEPVVASAAPVSAPAAPGADTPVAPAASTAAPPLRAGVVGFVLLQDGLTPGHVVGLGAALRLEWSVPGWQPLISLGAYSSGTEESQLENGRVRFTHWSSHAVACPWRFPSSGALGLRPCLELDAGRSLGEGVALAGAARHFAPWLSAGAQLQGEIRLWERLELGVSLAAVVPFWHAHFFLAPDIPSFETPSFGFRAGSSASLLF